VGIEKYSIRYHKDIPNDLKKIEGEVKKRIQASLLSKIQMNPLLLGDPLRSTLAGYRRLRVGDYRIIYQIDGDIIFVLIIVHKRNL